MDDKIKNCVILEEPLEVNSIEWAFEHPNCDALIIKNRKKSKYMTIKAYALNKDGNKELLSMCNDGKYGIFGGLDSSMLSFSGVVLLKKIVKNNKDIFVVDPREKDIEIEVPKQSNAWRHQTC